METNENLIIKQMHNSISKVMHENAVDYDVFRNWIKCGHVAYDDVSLVGNDDELWWDGVCHCGSASACPSCSRKIAIYRANEIREGIYRWKKMSADHDVFLLTFTMRHKYDLDIRQAIYDIKEANQRFFRDGVVRYYLEDNGIMGRVTSFEVKWSARNGLHPHFHIALFGNKGMDEKSIESDFGDKWLKMLSKVNRDGIKEIACNVKCASHVYNYLTKMSAEMTLGNITKNKGSSYTPLQLLYKYSAGDGFAFGRAYCRIVTALKGLSIVQWSRGFREYLGLKNFRDEDIVRREGALRDVYFTLNDKRDLRRFDCEQLELVRLAVQSGREDLIRELERILDKMKVNYNRYSLEKHIRMNKE